MLTAARLPMRLRPWASPTEVVDLPSPSGVGVIAVTTTYLPRGRSASSRSIAASVTLALVGPYSSSSSSAMPEVAGDVDDRARRDGAGDLEVGREAHRSPRGWRPVRVAAGPRAAWRPGGRAAWRSAARIRWVSSRALVSGPTPPGTGVIAEATSTRRREVDVADDPPVDDVDPDVDDDGAGLEHRPGDEPRAGRPRRRRCRRAGRAPARSRVRDGRRSPSRPP